MKNIIAWILICLPVLCSAQVDEIKSASKSNGRSGGGDSGGGGGGGFFVFDLFLQVIPQWQATKLQNNRERYPAVVSLDVMMQGAVKPSAYYMLWPRVRGNWGLFSTDFRMNYLIEDDIDGYQHIRTNDWQVLQLNLVTSRFFTFRVGTGFMQEAFGDKRMFSETALLFYVHAPDQSNIVAFEYRFAKDWETGVNPRRELSAQYQHELFEAGALHGYLTAGVTYQRYYNSIEVWGFQGGIMFRLF
jgi:hypothetical protein